uniref:Uncharacterized protein n=1 Tax=Amphimedon queenslandica TaxID=400682 RepID=A0A1X7UIL4_AMPQE
MLCSLELTHASRYVHVYYRHPLCHIQLHRLSQSSSASGEFSIDI